MCCKDLEILNKWSRTSVMIKCLIRDCCHIYQYHGLRIHGSLSDFLEIIKISNETSLHHKRAKYLVIWLAIFHVRSRVHTALLTTDVQSTIITVACTSDVTQLLHVMHIWVKFIAIKTASYNGYFTHGIAMGNWRFSMYVKWSYSWNKIPRSSFTSSWTLQIGPWISYATFKSLNSREVFI